MKPWEREALKKLRKEQRSQPESRPYAPSPEPPPYYRDNDRNRGVVIIDSNRDDSNTWQM